MQYNLSGHLSQCCKRRFEYGMSLLNCPNLRQVVQVSIPPHLSCTGYGLLLWRGMILDKAALCS